MVSLAIASCVIPVLNAALIRKVKVRVPGKRDITDWVQTIYDKMLAWNFRNPWKTIIGGVTITIVFICLFPLLKIRQFPYADRNQFAVEIYLPEGSGLNETSAIADSLCHVLEKDDRVTGITTFIGCSSPRFHASYAPIMAGKNFAQFIVYTPLRLAYKPGTEWAYLDCDVSRLDKSEISNTNGRLNCNIDFTASSKWYIPRLARRTTVDIVDAKRYSYSYNYTYAEAINGIINIDNASSEESPTIISIMGTITNPTWVLVVNNQVVQSGSVNATIPAGNKLIINSKDNALEIAEYVANSNVFVRNLYQASNFALDNFIYVPPGRSTLRISGEVSGAIDAWIEIEEIHETV